MHHVGAARVRVALPRGLACHVAPAWDPHAFCILFIYFKHFLNRN